METPSPWPVAGLAFTLVLLEEPAAYEQLENLGARLEAGLKQSAADAGVPVVVQRAGSMLTPFFVQPGHLAVENYADALRCDTRAYAKFFRVMLDGGVMLPPSQFEAWFVSTAHTEGDIDRTIDLAREAFKAAKM